MGTPVLFNRKTYNSSAAGGLDPYANPHYSSGFTPAPNTSDDESTPITMRFGPNNELPEQDPSVFDRVNEMAGELRITESGTPVLDYSKGFRTIKDYFTYADLPNAFNQGQITITQHVLSGDKTPMKNPGGIFNKKRNKPIVDLSGMIELIINAGFIRISNSAGGFRYTLFNNLNMPCEYIDIDKSANRKSRYISGLVKQSTYDAIEKACAHNLEPVKEKIQLRQLDEYVEVQPGNTVARFIDLELTDDMDYALPEFYPWVKMGIHDYFKEFLESRSNVLVLIGPPGTGKSTLIRTIIRDLNVRSMLAYKPDVVASPKFIKTCQEFLAQDHNYEDYMNARNSEEPVSTARRHKAIVVEDADLIMGKRSDGNHRMSEILNATSGIASDMHSKFILSTNLKDISDIDPALLRPGRCFDVLCFRDLSAEEAMLVRSARGMEPRDFQNNRRYKLAEVLANVLTQNQVEPIVKPRFGFV